MKGCSQRVKKKRRETGSSQAGQMEEDRDRYGRMRKKNRENRRAALRETSAPRQPAGGSVGEGCSEQGRGLVRGGWSREQLKLQINM